jgi:hypothetical protein
VNVLKGVELAVPFTGFFHNQAPMPETCSLNLVRNMDTLSTEISTVCSTLTCSLLKVIGFTSHILARLLSVNQLIVEHVYVATRQLSTSQHTRLANFVMPLGELILSMSSLFVLSLLLLCSQLPPAISTASLLGRLRCSLPEIGT